MAEEHISNYNSEKVRKALYRQEGSIKVFSLEVRTNTTESIPKMKKRVKYFQSKIRIKILKKKDIKGNQAGVKLYGRLKSISGFVSITAW